MPPRSSSITSLSLTGVQIFSCRYLGTKAGTRGPPSIGGCCKSSNLTSIRNLPRPALRGEGWGGGAASGNCIMTTGSYIADSTEFLTSLHFALTSTLFLRRGRICFFALLTFLVGSPKHITLGLLQHPPMGEREASQRSLAGLLRRLTAQGQGRRFDSAPRAGYRQAI